ncbi:phenylalanine--tRNA ligase subunit beta [Facklamia hominis]|uniref:phenylalanine--tRNA ligase subunit beta n=1 Tax=Facklamia hominis TaxID=178214 RepID=UPI00101D3A4B|nr:phenylalanine--tRNA ligase subunit beta [Facklamia hominis]RYC97527.1 phenylalanine--tRNA ligase subunit beta [Facklamia hominis]
MLVSYRWLSELLDLSGHQAEEIAEKMSRTGIEIEGVTNIADDLKGPLLVGQVVEQHAHPDSDHLQITQVDVGQSEPLQIVCGAPNVHQGAKVIVALVGAELPGGFKIKSSKLRGEVSNGMLCSLQEIGFSDSVVAKEFADGIMLLPEDAPIGTSVIEYLALDDPILELSITPNRADALSMYGTAYEVGAIVNQEPHFDHLSLQADQVAAIDYLDQVQVKVLDPKMSAHYQLRLVKGVMVKPSPIALQIKLMKANIRPINNIVDATNYSLIMYGQPLHAFDFDALKSKSISVRKAYPDETLVTLDEVDRQLESSDLVIAAGDQAVALAGLMGGLSTHVTDQTKTVLIESAVFEGQTIRRSSRRLGLRSESSSRFEKGINRDLTSFAGEQASIMMAQLGHGQVEEGVVEVVNQPAQSVQVTVEKSQISDKLGIELTDNELQAIFDRLGFGLTFTDEDFTVTVPARRWDIAIPADILEEIARIYGYDNIPDTLPQATGKPAQLTRRQKLIRASRSILESVGLTECVSYVLVSDKEAALTEHAGIPVKLQYPMSEDHAVLRQSLLASLLDIAQYNRARHNGPLAFYEIGKVFYGQEVENTQPTEIEKLSILLSGQSQASNWYQKQTNYDFYDIKGMLESYFDDLGIFDRIQFQVEEEISFMHPGQTARVFFDGQSIGYLGQVHPHLAKEFDLEAATYFAELNMEPIFNEEVADLTQIPLAKYPETSRDLALLVDQATAHQDLVDIISQAAGEHLIELDLFDLYEGDRIEAGKKSLAYRLTFQDPTKTLTDEEVKASMDRIEEALRQVQGLEIR